MGTRKQKRRSRSRRKDRSRSSHKSESTGEEDAHAPSRSRARGRDSRSRTRAYPPPGKEDYLPRGKDYCVQHGKMRNLSALDADTHICIPGDRCKDKGHWQQQQASSGGKGNWANDAECAQWRSHYERHGGYNYDHNPIGSKGYYYDDKGKGKDRSAPSRPKGSGRGSSSHNPAPHPPKGSGRGPSSHNPVPHSHRRRAGSPDANEIDL